MDNETCHELKSIEYKSNLLNRNSSRRLSSASNTNSTKRIQYDEWITIGILNLQFQIANFIFQSERTMVQFINST